MFISIGVNVVNIAASVLCVYALHMGFTGIATGTLVAEWLGLAGSVIYLLGRYDWLRRMIDLGNMLNFDGARHFFSVSADIFLRSLLMMVMNLAVVSIGARSGDLILAVNALIAIEHVFRLFPRRHRLCGRGVGGEICGAP